MRGPRLVGYPPERVYWSQDSQRVYFRWKGPDEPRLKELSLYVVNRDGTGLRRLSDDEARQAPPAASWARVAPGRCRTSSSALRRMRDRRCLRRR